MMEKKRNDLFIGPNASWKATDILIELPLVIFSRNCFDFDFTHTLFVCMYVEYVLHFVQTIFVKTFSHATSFAYLHVDFTTKIISLFCLMKWVWLCFYLQITECSGQRQWKNWVSFLNSKCTWTYLDVMELSECFGDMWKNWKMTT